MKIIRSDYRYHPHLRPSDCAACDRLNLIEVFLVAILDTGKEVFLGNTLTAQKVSPPVFEVMEIIGRKVVLKRIALGIELLEDMR